MGFAAAIDDRLKKRLERGAKRKAVQSLEESSKEQVGAQIKLLLHGCRSLLKQQACWQSYPELHGQALRSTSLWLLVQLSKSVIAVWKGI